MRGVRAFAIPIVLLALIGAGCSKKADTTTAKAPTYTITTSEPAAKQYAFSVPSGMKGGVITLKLDNAAGKQRHDFQVVEAVSGHTLQEVVNTVSDDKAAVPNWLIPPGGIGGTAPGGSNQSIVDFKPGTYWYFCTETADDGTSHAKNGMNGEMKLEGSSGAPLPATTSSIVASEYTFATTNLKAGTNTIEFRNEGKMLHHALLFPIVAGKTLDDVKKGLADENAPGPPPVDFEKSVGSAVLGGGKEVVYSAELTAGTNYALLCFMPDIGTAGPPHFTKGMVVEVKVA